LPASRRGQKRSPKIERVALGPRKSAARTIAVGASPRSISAAASARSTPFFERGSTGVSSARRPSPARRYM
jgi:hypothetical protein